MVKCDPKDVRPLAPSLVRELLAAREDVRFIPVWLMAESRSGGRERGKSDPIDALASKPLDIGASWRRDIGQRGGGPDRPRRRAPDAGSRPENADRE